MGFINPINVEDFEELMEKMVDPSLLSDIEGVTHELNLTKLLGVEIQVSFKVTYNLDLDDYHKMKLKFHDGHIGILEKILNGKETKKSKSDLVSALVTKLRESYRFDQRTMKREITKQLTAYYSGHIMKKLRAKRANIVLTEAIETHSHAPLNDSYIPIYESSGKAFLSLKRSIEFIKPLIDAFKNNWGSIGTSSQQIMDNEDCLISFINFLTIEVNDLTYYAQIKNAPPALVKQI